MGCSQTQKLVEMFITNCESTSFQGWVCCLFLCGCVLTWIYGQNKPVKFTLPLPWNDLNPGQRPSYMRQGSSKPIQQCKLKTIECYFCVHGLTKHIARYLSTCFRDPFEALKSGLISNYLPTPPHMAGNTEGSPD